MVKQLASCRNILCNLSLPWKIIAICAVSSFITLSVLVTLALVRDWESFRERRVGNLATLSKITAINMAASLRFDDRKTASEYLEAFRSEKDIRSVLLFDSAGNPWISYDRDPEENHPSQPDFLGPRWESGRLLFSENVELGGKIDGRILIVLDTRSYQELVGKSLLTGVSLLIAGLAITLVLVSRMQRVVTNPIRELVDLTQQVTQGDSFSLRAQKRYSDEVGALVDSFNSMLENIESRDASLRALNADLEVQVEKRTHDLRIRNKELESAMKAAKAASVAKSEFLARTSHELRTPLNPVIGYVEKMLRERPDGPNAKELSLVRQAAQQLLRLIDDILDFSRIENRVIKLSKDRVDVSELCEAAIGLMMPKAEEKGLFFKESISIENDANQSEILLLTDEGRLRQVILNLLSNAIKFTRSGGVTLTAEVKRTDDKRAKLTLSIADTGIGIPESQANRLFKPFSQIDGTWTREFGGMGLGLAICRSILEVMGGTIRFESSPGLGSTFFVEIETDIAPELEDDSPTSANDLLGIAEATPAEVLLVEDEMVNRELMSALLGGLGHNVTPACNGIEALEQIDAKAFDFVLLDISMPKMDGFETTRRIRALGGQFLSLPIVAMTAHATPEDRERCLQVGMDDYLSKPISFTKLKAVLSTWLQKRKTT